MASVLCHAFAQEHSGVVGYEASGSAVATAMGKAVVAELRQLFPLLLADGTLAAVDNESKEPVYFPMDLPSVQGTVLIHCVYCCMHSSRF